MSVSQLVRLPANQSEAGLLCRKRCPNDRRGQYAVLTPEGLALRKAIWQIYSQSVAKHVASHLSDPEVAVLSQAFERTIAASQLPLD